MAKKQTRRSISVNRVEFETMKAIAQAADVSVSKLTEGALRHFVATARETGGPAWLTKLGEMARTPA